MQATQKPQKFSVCLTRQELSIVRAALRVWHGKALRDHCPGAGYTVATYDALQRVHQTILDIGGVDDTK